MDEIKKKVILAEDDEMLSEIYQKKLGEGDFELIMVKNGREAYEKAKKIIPDLVLLDLVMPEMDGFEALRLIKSEPGLEKVKVVITSNLSQEDEKKKAVDMGAEDFLIKSNYDLGELAKKVQSYL